MHLLWTRRKLYVIQYDNYAAELKITEYGLINTIVSKGYMLLPLPMSYCLLAMTFQLPEVAGHVISSIHSHDKSRLCHMVAKREQYDLQSALWSHSYGFYEVMS